MHIIQVCILFNQYNIHTCTVCIIIIYCTLCGQIKGTKCTLFSIKCKGAVWIKSTVIKLRNLLLFLFHSAFQKVIIAFCMPALH